MALRKRSASDGSARAARGVRTQGAALMLVALIVSGLGLAVARRRRGTDVVGSD